MGARGPNKRGLFSKQRQQAPRCAPQVNRGRFPLHVDGCNLGESAILSSGQAAGGELWVFACSDVAVAPGAAAEPRAVKLDCNYGHLCRFDGRDPHITLAYEGNDRVRRRGGAQSYSPRATWGWPPTLPSFFSSFLLHVRTAAAR